MSAAACAKIIIDNYGALGGAATGMATSAEASCEALMQLVEAKPELWPEVRVITDRACYWAAEIEEWKKELNTAVRELAEKALSAESKKSRKPAATGEGL